MAEKRWDYIYDVLGQEAINITMNRIISYGEGCIFQGGASAAHDLKRLRNQHIGLLINCTSNVPGPVWANQRGTPVHVVFPIFGGPFSDALRRGHSLTELEPLFEQIQETLVRYRQNVMIHCEQAPIVQEPWESFSPCISCVSHPGRRWGM